MTTSIAPAVGGGSNLSAVGQERVQTVTDVEAIEDCFVQQWRHFGQGPNGTVHEEPDLVWIEAPVVQLPYNGVLRTRLGPNADERIDEVIERFRERGVDFFWMAHPTATPTDLPDRLAARGLTVVEQSTGMALDIGSWPGPQAEPGRVVYREVTDESGMEDFNQLIAEYWELRDESRDYVFWVSRWEYSLGDRGVRYVAYLDDRPIGKAYLSFRAPPDTSAIFAVYVTPEGRGHGVATVLTELLVERARSSGRSRVVLHSTEMAVGVYRRIGFVDRCPFPVYATTALHGVH